MTKLHKISTYLELKIKMNFSQKNSDVSVMLTPAICISLIMETNQVSYFQNSRQNVTVECLPFWITIRFVHD